MSIISSIEASWTSAQLEIIGKLTDLSYKKLQHYNEVLHLIREHEHPFTAFGETPGIIAAPILEKRQKWIRRVWSLSARTKKLYEAQEDRIFSAQEDHRKNEQ